MPKVFQNRQLEIGNRQSLLCLKLLLNDNAELFGRQLLKRHFAAVHEDGWRAFHAERVSAFSVLENPLLHEVTTGIAIVTIDVESDLSRVAFKNRPHVELSFPGVLTVVEEFVHLPELALEAGSFGC